jgi:hypothetical protein
MLAHGIKTKLAYDCLPFLIINLTTRIATKLDLGSQSGHRQKELHLLRRIAP